MTTATFTIRPVAAGDAARCAAIVEQVFAEYGFAFDLAGFDKDLAAPHLSYAGHDRMFAVAELQGRMLGFAGCHIEPDGTRAELHRLYLDPAARGLGAGRALCLHVENWARARDVKSMELWSDVRLTHGHALYRSLGYRVFGSRDIDDADRSVEFGMSRVLADAAVFADDPLTPGLRASIRPLSEELVRGNAGLLHRARMTAAGIVDARKLVGRPLPEPRDLFGGMPGPIEALMGDGFTLTGFRLLTAEVPHPSCMPTPRDPGSRPPR